ncbi:MAG: DNA repair protein RadC [Solobacterium sp.]|jgi:DNA repair protein RadC|nr:DNA repair protein RadC [Solobacterium sp.]MCH4221831.1 DNA repair protein RadC [Solobacterium sp.]MCH4265053.1 DNA repair protein RadC [Solobacterium sp.]
MMIKDLPVEERPREKGLREGIEELSSRELLAVLLRSGTKGQSVLETADQVIEKAGGVQNLNALSIQQLSEIKGIQKVKALELQASFELARRIYDGRMKQRNVMKRPDDFGIYLRQKIGASHQEEVLAVYLNLSHEIIDSEILFRGTAETSLISPYEILQGALLRHSKRLVIAHNHPSGSCEPSDLDIANTLKLARAAELMDIVLLDHVIVTMQDCFSFHQAGFLNQTADSAF